MRSLGLIIAFIVCLPAATPVWGDCGDELIRAVEAAAPIHPNPLPIREHSKTSRNRKAKVIVSKRLKDHHLNAGMQEALRFFGLPDHRMPDYADLKTAYDSRMEDIRSDKNPGAKIPRHLIQDMKKDAERDEASALRYIEILESFYE